MSEKVLKTEKIRSKKNQNIIIKYDNRKMYSYRTRSYVTLGQIEGIFQVYPDTVIKSATGSDITKSVLTSVVLGALKDTLKIRSLEDVKGLLGLQSDINQVRL